MVISGELSLVPLAKGDRFRIENGVDACGGGGGTVRIGLSVPFSHEYYVCANNATGQLRLLQADDVGFNGPECTFAVRPGMGKGRPAAPDSAFFSLLSPVRAASFVGVAADGESLALLPMSNSSAFAEAVTMRTDF